MPERLQRLNMTVLTIVIIYTIAVQNTLQHVTIVNKYVDSFVALLTSVGFYRLLLVVIYAAVERSSFLLKLYWGRLYLAGLWAYTYTKGKGTDSKRYFGIWRFEQDLVSVRVVGFGLDESFTQRSTVRSVTDLIENRGVFEIVNLRRDAIDPDTDYYSTTSLVLEYRRRRIGQTYPIKMRSQTIIYGGTLSGDVHNDEFVKHESARTEEDVVNELKREFGQGSQA